MGLSLSITMPSHSISSAFTQLWGNANGAPWNYPTWLEHTKLPDGIFPEDDLKLPSAWSRQDVDHIMQFFDEYQKISSETERLRFAQKTKGLLPPGQPLWRDFLRKGWPKWKAHAMIVEQLRISGVHPLVIQQDEGTAEWPRADSYLPVALNSIGLALFGPEAFEGKEILPLKIRNPLRMIVQHSWDNLCRTASNGQQKLEEFQKAGLAAVNGRCYNFNVFSGLMI